MMHIKVPATSANMGPGFDSIGVALQLYNHLWFEQIEEGLEIIIKRKHLCFVCIPVVIRKMQNLLNIPDKCRTPKVWNIVIHITSDNILILD